MSIYLEHQHLENKHKSIQFKHDITGSSSMETIKSYIMQTYTSDELPSVPSCMCGATTDQFRVGVICRTCDTRVASPSDKVEPYLWLTSNDEFSEGFITPLTWVTINNIVSPRIDTLRYVSDPRYNVPLKHKIPKLIIGKIMAMDGYERSYNWLTKNLHKIVYMLNTSSLVNKADRGGLDIILNLLKNDRKKVITTKMPIPGKEIFVMISKGGYKKAHLEPTVLVHDLAFTYMNRIDDPKYQERLMVKICSLLAQLAELNVQKFLAGKYTLMRKHIYGLRLDFTSRGTIVPINGPHNYYDLHMPWGMALVLFKPHLMNLLAKRGIYYKESSQLLIDCVRRYDPIIAECLNELISGSADKRGIPVGWQRPPSLLAGSWTTMYISKFKFDITDETISMSDMATKLSNADFDGDQMHVTVYIDNMMAREMSTMDPHHSAMSPNEMKVSDMMTLGKPTVTNISNSIRMTRLEYGI